jgi:hypothetical protein
MTLSFVLLCTQLARWVRLLLILLEVSPMEIPKSSVCTIMFLMVRPVYFRKTSSPLWMGFSVDSGASTRTASANWPHTPFRRLRKLSSPLWGVVVSFWAYNTDSHVKGKSKSSNAKLRSRTMRIGIQSKYQGRSPSLPRVPRRPVAAVSEHRVLHVGPRINAPWRVAKNL